MPRKLLTALVLTTLASAAAVADTTAFVNVNVVPMTSETVLRARTVIVEDDRITEIGPVASTVVPDEARVVDGTDRYLLPGLAEMHGHVTRTDDASLERLFTLFLANGVTTVRGMLGRVEHLELRRELDSGARIGPRFVTSGPSLNGNSVTSPAQAERKVREQHAAGYDFLKIHPGLTRAEFLRVADTANELGMPFAGHVPSSVGVPLALESGIATIDHLDGYMETLIPADNDPTGGLGGFFGLMLAGVARESAITPIVKATREAGTWNVPTQTLFEQTANDLPAADLAARPEMKYARADDVRQWVRTKRSLVGDADFDRRIANRAIALRRALIKALHADGAGLLLGSDSPQRFNVPGFALHRELELMVAAGLTPYEALSTGTVNPARFLGVADERGTVQPGRAADLVLLDENPLDDIANSRRVHGTMIRGTWLSRSELDRRLKAAESG